MSVGVVTEAERVTRAAAQIRRAVVAVDQAMRPAWQRFLVWFRRVDAVLRTAIIRELGDSTLLELGDRVAYHMLLNVDDEEGER